PAGREPGERLVGELEYSPLRERLGAELLVESDRRRIPVERRPLESDAAPLDREAGQAPQQRRADPAAPVRLVDVQVLQVDAVPSSPGEILLVEEREADRRGVALREQALEGWLRRRHLLPQDVGRDLDRVGLAGVGGEREDEGVKRRRVVGTSEANPATHGPILARRPRFEKCWVDHDDFERYPSTAGGPSTSCRRGWNAAERDGEPVTVCRVRRASGAA